MNYKNEHKDIPGNPSAVKSSKYKLNDRIIRHAKVIVSKGKK